jgi:hypothetical protein
MRAGDRVFIDLYGFGPDMPGTIHEDSGSLSVVLDTELHAHPGEGAEVWAYDPEYVKPLP